MLHTNRESYTLRSFQQQGPESSGKNEKPFTLKEETIKAINERKTLEDAQKSEIDKFLKSISWADGITLSTLSEEQKKTLGEMLRILDIQNKDNETLDTNVIREKLWIQKETQQALAAAKESAEGNSAPAKVEVTVTDKKLAKGMSEDKNPEFTELKKLLIKSGCLDAKYANKNIKYGDETVAAIKKYNAANPKYSLWENVEEVSIARVRELSKINVTKGTPVQPLTAPKERVETSSTILAKRVQKGTDIKSIPESEKQATERLQAALAILWLYKWVKDGVFGQGTENAIKEFLASKDNRGNLLESTNPLEVTEALTIRIEEIASKKQRIAGAQGDASKETSRVARQKSAPSLTQWEQKGARSRISWIGQTDVSPRGNSWVRTRIETPSLTQRNGVPKPPVAPWYTREWSELIADLHDVNRYLQAFNETYGERGNLISNKNGIFGIARQISYPDSIDFAKKLWITEDRLEQFASSLGVSTGRFNDKTVDWIKRTLMIAAVSVAISLIMSGGWSVAVELFGINYTENFRNGPQMQQILTLLTNRDPNITRKFKNVLVSKNTTQRDVEWVFGELKKTDMIPNNVRKDVKEIFSQNFIIDFFNDLFQDDHDGIEPLLKQFEQARTVEEGERILTRITNIATARYYAKYPSGAQSDVLARLATSLGTIRNLKAKRDSIEKRRTGRDNFDKARYLQDTNIIQGILDAQYWVPERTIKLKNSQSYAPALPRDLNPDKLHEMLRVMVNTRINGDKTSILANLMRWVNYHYGISFQPQEFINAFENMHWLNWAERRKFNDRILSNTWRQRNQTFNELNLSSGVAVMRLNGKDIYFKDACTNVLTVVDDIPTTIQMAQSLPITVAIAGSWFSGWNGGGGWRIPTGQWSHTGVEGGWVGGGGGWTPLPIGWWR